MDIEPVTQHEMHRELGAAVSLGGAALNGRGLGHLEFVAIQNSGEASLFEMDYPYTRDVIATRGLRLAGVMRKQSIKRRYMDCQTSDIKPGDKAVLVDDDGSEVITSKLKHLL